MASKKIKSNKKSTAKKSRSSSIRKKSKKTSLELVPTSELSPASTDLDKYLMSIRRHPLLSPERELEVAKKVYDHQDSDAAREMVLSNLRLVVKIAHDYIRSGFSLLDLIQEGNIGLLQAVKEYDPYRGVKFSSYASYWIKAYIRSFILKNWSLVKMGTTRAQRALFYRLQKEKNQLEAMGIVPETKWLAEKFNVKEREVEEMSQRLSGRDVSLNAPIHSDSSDSEGLIQFIDDSSESIDEKLADAQIRHEFQNRLDAFEKTLSGKELIVFRERLRSEEPKTLQEIGDAYKITRERVRQIEARVLEKLKSYMKEKASFKDTIIDISPTK
ncbi:MAG: RNA polymerase factor sigma-32 [Bdellovibrionota bacterium]